MGKDVQIAQLWAEIHLIRDKEYRNAQQIKALAKKGRLVFVEQEVETTTSWGGIDRYTKWVAIEEGKLDG